MQFSIFAYCSPLIGGGFYTYLTDSPNNAGKGRLVKDRRFGVDWIYELAKRIAEKMAWNRIAQMPENSRHRVIRGTILNARYAIMR